MDSLQRGWTQAGWLRSLVFAGDAVWIWPGSLSGVSRGQLCLGQDGMWAHSQHRDRASQSHSKRQERST